MKFFRLDKQDEPGAGTEPSTYFRETPEGIAIDVRDGQGNGLALQLSAVQAIELARHLFTSALRQSAHTANGRLAAGIAARIMVRQAQDVAKQVSDGRTGD